MNCQAREELSNLEKTKELLAFYNEIFSEFLKTHKNAVTIPHDIYIKNGAAKILLKPAPQGSGIIAGGAVRVVVEAAGITSISSKILGTKNQASNVYAALEALRNLKES